MHVLTSLPSSPLAAPPSSGDERAAPMARESDLMGEIIGARLTITRAPGWTPLPFEGVVVDETRNTLRVTPLAGGAARILQKRALEGTLGFGARAISFKGDELRHRPEDRIKRLAPRGRSPRP